jgi:hypothetical protein
MLAPFAPDEVRIEEFLVFQPLLVQQRLRLFSEYERKARLQRYLSPDVRSDTQHNILDFGSPPDTRQHFEGSCMAQT